MLFYILPSPTTSVRDLNFLEFTFQNGFDHFDPVIQSERENFDLDSSWGTQNCSQISQIIVDLYIIKVMK